MMTEVARARDRNYRDRRRDRDKDRDMEIKMEREGEKAIQLPVMPSSSGYVKFFRMLRSSLVPS